MNKNGLSIAFALALSMSWVGCNKSGKLDEPSTSAMPSGPADLKLKWTQGEHIVQAMDMKQNAEINVPGQPEPMKQAMQMGQDYALTVLKSNPDGGHEIELEFLGVHMKMEMGGKTMMDFDSSKKQTGDKADPMADVYGKLVGAKIRYFMDASNNVDRLEGTDALIERISSGSGAAAAASFKTMFNDGYLKQMMSQARFLPPKPVQPGDTWPVKVEMPMGPLGTLVMEFTVTLKDWEKHGLRNCARLDFDGTLKSTPSQDSTAGPVSISSLEGTSTGTSWFDPELGMIIDNNMNQDMTMVMSMKMGSMQNMTNHMLQNMSIKLVSVK